MNCNNIFQFTTKLPQNLNYSIRFPAELRFGLDVKKEYNFLNWNTNLIFPIINKFELKEYGIPPGYRQEGFLAVQNTIAGSYLKIASNYKMPAIKIRVSFFFIYCSQ